MKAKMKKVLKNNKGFTMIELMVVIVIMLILAAIAIPTFNRLINQANTSAATAEVRTVLMLAQLESETIVAKDGSIATVADASQGEADAITTDAWKAILEDSGITDSTEQGYFTYTIDSSGTVTVYYNNGSGVIAQLPEASE